MFLCLQQAYRDRLQIAINQRMRKRRAACGTREHEMLNFRFNKHNR